MGFKSATPINFYANSGVMVWPKRYQHLLAPPDRVPANRDGAHWTAEQEWWTATLQDAKAHVCLMDGRANVQNWHDEGFKDQTPECLLHWSGQADHGRARRIDDLRRWAEAPPVARVLTRASRRTGGPSTAFTANGSTAS
jgi:hypothetical protein